MTARRVIVALWVLGLVGARAELAAAQQVAAPGQAPGELRCQRVDCDCAAPPMASADGLVYQPLASRGCRQVTCRCAETATPTPTPTPTAPAAPPPPPLPAPQPPQEIFVEEPAPVGGFTLPRRGVGIKLEVGHPFVDAQLAYGLHDAVELDAGYRGMWTTSNGGYGGLRFRLYRSRSGTAALSFSLLGGYTHIQRGENHLFITKFNGGDSGFLESAFGFSAGRGRHAFIASVGVRLAWVQEHRNCELETEYSEDCENTIFFDGHAGFLPIAFFDVGYAVRLHRLVSLYFATGIDGFTNSQALGAMIRHRFGLMVDF